MKEEIDEKTKCKLILIVLVIFTVLLLVFGLLLINHSKQINPDTVEVKPQQLIMGTELEEIDSLVVKEQVNMKELVIPAHSVYSGTKGLVLDESSIKNTFEILGLNRMWFSTAMHIYAWHNIVKRQYQQTVAQQ